MRIFGYLAILFILVSGHAWAQAQTCDPDFYDVMSARAELEGIREMEAAQHIIRKPDSTLEYSCFAFNVLDVMASQANFLFSDDQDPNSMDTALDLLVLTAMNRYLDQNFWHLYLGGSFPGFPVGPLVCDAMNQVWLASKCEDFDFEFLTFAEMAAGDRRTLPNPCPNPADRTDYINAAIAAAFPVAGAVGGIDDLDPYLEEMSSCDTPPVQTGVIVSSTLRPDYADAVCIAPGCYHDGAGDCRPVP